MPRPVEPSLSSGAWSYLESAAVLSSFDPVSLRPNAPLKARVAQQGLAELVKASTVTYDAAGKLMWTLRPEVRRSALARLSTGSKLKEAIARNSAWTKDDPLARVLVPLLTGGPFSVNQFSRDELAVALQARDWIADLAPAIPNRSVFVRRLEIIDLFAPFSRLIGDHFRGRTRELSMLSHFVHEDSGSLAVVHGIGGSGKSSLISKFILDNNVDAADEPLRFVYLDFDRASLVAKQPWTSLIEAAAQLEVQLPEYAVTLKETRSAWLARALETSAETSGGDVYVSSEADVFEELTSVFISDFVALATSLGIKKLLWIFDTFEEVQYQGRGVLSVVLAFVQRLRTELASRAGKVLKSVIVSRTDPHIPDVLMINIGELDSEAAISLLRAHGVPARDASTIVGKIGGNPLTLNLFIQSYSREGRQSFSALRGGHSQQFIQGLLYRRILRHIHNDDVKKLAHPGLVLRRITPDLIYGVLAVPCAVRVNDMKRAQDLFAELRREDTLVYVTDDGSLAHREDVRKVMLDLLVKDAPDQVRHIHELAIAYYCQRNDLPSRAEEIYHRLALRQPSSEVDARWEEGAERYLVSSIEELPDSGQVYVASRAGIDLNEEIWSRASLQDWERRAERQAQEFIGAAMYRRALQVVHERKERSPGSRLWLIEAQIHIRLNHRASAIKCAKKGLESAREARQPKAEMEHLVFLAALEAQAQRYGNSYELMSEALSLAKGDDPIRVLQVSFDRMVLLKKWKGSAGKKLQMERETLKTFHVIDLASFSQNRDLLFDIAAELGGKYPPIVRKILVQLGLPTNVRLPALSDFLTAWASENRSRSSGINVINTIRSAPQPGGRLPSWGKYVASTPVATISDAIRTVARQLPVGQRSAKLLARIYTDRRPPPIIPNRRKTSMTPKSAKSMYSGGRWRSTGSSGSRKASFARLTSSRKRMRLK